MRVLLIGAAFAGLVGALAGGVARPVLDIGARPMTEAAAWRDIAPTDGGVSTYDGAPPDYVIGTDWLHPADDYPPVMVEADPPVEPVDLPEPPPPPEPAPSQAQAPPEAPRPPTAPAAWPSVSGDILSGVPEPVEAPTYGPDA